MDLEVLKIAANTKKHRLLKSYDHIYRQKNSFCGDEIIISLKVKNKKIYKIGFNCKSCMYTQASAALLSDYSINKSFEEIQNMNLELNKYFKKQTLKLPKKLNKFSKIVKNRNFPRKDCILLPFNALNKMIKSL